MKEFPVDPQKMREMEHLARLLFKLLDEASDGALQPPNPKMGAALFLFSFYDRGEMTYISNANRGDMVKMLQEFIARNPPEMTWDQQHG
ncbi:MAG: hypothetical protein HRJ53_12890 [Acidobacteria bacterium Pan2503]|uniref:Uncharacterized protein n=1 Tax=Candidatus Acidiferrum panamense TaxID=2741543 RepID=A0A7V8NR99_9BACT|nr:hypothetical protein [Candidatus Acidoferrum panamensis]